MELSKSQNEETEVWEFRTLRDARKPRAPTEYIIDKFLATHTLNIVYGAPGSLKSMIVLDAALNVSSGMQWLPGANGNGAGINVKQRPVIWIDIDNGQRRTDERVDAMSKMKHIENDAPFYYICMPVPMLIAHDIESMGYLHDSICAFDAGMVVIDNLGLVTGNVDENSSQMAQVMKNLRWLAESTGVALVILHHQRKGGANNSRAGDALRGHSSIEGSLDLALHVIREANTNEITIKSTKTRGVDVPNVVARFYYEHIVNTNDLDLAWFESTTRASGGDALAQSIEFMVDGNERITKTKLVQLVYSDLQQEYSYQKIRAEIDNMLQVTGELTLTEGKNNAKIITMGTGF